MSKILSIKINEKANSPEAKHFWIASKAGEVFPVIEKKVDENTEVTHFEVDNGPRPKECGIKEGWTVRGDFCDIFHIEQNLQTENVVFCPNCRKMVLTQEGIGAWLKNISEKGKKELQCCHCKKKFFVTLIN